MGFNFGSPCWMRKLYFLDLFGTFGTSRHEFGIGMPRGKEGSIQNFQDSGHLGQGGWTFRQIQLLIGHFQLCQSQALAACLQSILGHAQMPSSLGIKGCQLSVSCWWLTFVVCWCLRMFVDVCWCLRSTSSFSVFTSGLKIAKLALKFCPVPKLQVQADVVCFGAVLSAFQKAAQWRKALRFLRDMPTLRGSHNAFCYSSVMTACEKATQWLKALELFEAMREQIVVPDAVSYGAAISSCGKVGKWEAGDSTWWLSLCFQPFVLTVDQLFGLAGSTAFLQCYVEGPNSAQHHQKLVESFRSRSCLFVFCFCFCLF